MAAINEQQDGSLDVATRLTALSGYQIVGLMAALADQALAIASSSSELKLFAQYGRLQLIKELLAGGDQV